MECQAARNSIFRLLDAEISAPEKTALDSHLEGCESCAQDLKLLMLPRRLARALPVLQPSPFFYQKLRARLEETSRNVSIWHILVGLSRQVVPALACVTLVLLSVFAYQQLGSSQDDVYQAYELIFTSPERPQRMVIADAEEITDETVLRVVAEGIGASPAGPGRDR